MRLTPRPVIFLSKVSIPELPYASRCMADLSASSNLMAGLTNKDGGAWSAGGSRARALRSLRGADQARRAVGFGAQRSRPRRVLGSRTQSVQPSDIEAPRAQTLAPVVKTTL